MIHPNRIDLELTDIAYSGHVDLQNCEDEPIHVPGSIQSCGYLIAIDQQQVVKFCSKNCHALGLKAADILEQKLASFLDETTLETITTAVSQKKDEMAAVVFCISVGGQSLNLLVHAVGELTVLEFEQDTETAKDVPLLNTRTLAFSRNLAKATTLGQLCQMVAENIQEIIGYDRVMVYKFDPDYNGIVLAEKLIGTHESYLGLNYPHTDIPPQARELYLKNLVRTIPDTHYEPVPILTRQPDSKHANLDLSLSVLRSVSPIHVQYLRNMGVRATFTASILSEGKLWGMVACHHYSPKVVHFQDRISALLQATLLGSQIKVASASDELNEKRVLEQAFLKVQELIYATELSGSNAAVPEAFHKFLNADAFVLESNLMPIRSGPVNYQQDIDNLLGIVAKKAIDFFVSDNIKQDLGYEAHSGIAGILYHRFGNGTQAMWLRKEVKEEVTWAGNPHKAVSKEKQGLSPRLSFAAWTEIRSNFSRSWRTNDLEIAKSCIFAIQNRMAYLSSQLVQIEQHQMMNQLVKTNAELENILWITSHDLQEPIRKIRMFISLMEEEEAVALNNKLSKTVTRITNSAERMQKLLDDLLLLNRSRRLETSNQFIDLNAVLRETEKIYQDYDFELIITPKFPPIKGKEVLVKQLITNVVDNSIKYAHPERPLVVSIDFEKKDALLAIIITDNGVGFDMRYASLIFQIFKRVNDDATIKGTGVGLSVCKKIVESMDGNIYAESEKGKGTRIVIELPFD